MVAFVLWCKPPFVRKITVTIKGQGDEFGILHMPSKALDTFFERKTAKRKCYSGKCKPKNEGCHGFLFDDDQLILPGAQTDFFRMIQTAAPFGLGRGVGEVILVINKVCF